MASRPSRLFKPGSVQKLDRFQKLVQLTKGLQLAILNHFLHGASFLIFGYISLLSTGLMEKGSAWLCYPRDLMPLYAAKESHSFPPSSASVAVRPIFSLHRYISQFCLQQDNPILSCGELKTQDLFHRIFLHYFLSYYYF